MIHTELPWKKAKEDAVNNHYQLIEAINTLLNCTDLNLDNLDETSIEAIEKARKVLDKMGK